MNARGWGGVVVRVGFALIAAARPSPLCLTMKQFNTKQKQTLKRNVCRLTVFDKPADLLFK